jgi:hypothetical protein
MSNKPTIEELIDLEKRLKNDVRKEDKPLNM